MLLALVTVWSHCQGDIAENVKVSQLVGQLPEVGHPSVFSCFYARLVSADTTSVLSCFYARLVSADTTSVLSCFYARLVSADTTRTHTLQHICT